jgi:hypothetical protein
MISINNLLTQFSSLLVLYWENLLLLVKEDSTGSLKDDWLQANWELIVEGLLDDKNIVLEVYGDGADCNGESSRVLYPDRQPTHRLICKPLDGNYIYDVLNEKSLDITQGDIIFDRFVSIGEDGWYHELPPFDKILGEYAGEAVVVDFSGVDVQLQLLKDR